MGNNRRRDRPLIAFFDFPDVFEDFYSHYGVSHEEFCTRWSDTGNHAFVRALQRYVGDVVWYEFSLAPELTEACHDGIGCRMRMLPSSILHRGLWKLYYLPRCSWRWRRSYRGYATFASYLSLLSSSFLKALRKDRPDFFFVQDYATGRYDVLRWISQVMKRPLLAYHSGSEPETYLGKTAKRWTIPAADGLLASSQAELDMLVSRYGVSRERARVILTPIDTDLFCPQDRAAACQALNLCAANRYVLFMGRLDDEVKRVSALIRAFSQATSDAHARAPARAQLLIAGDGRDGPRLRRLAQQMAPGKVQFLGWISDPQTKASLYNAAEALVLPSAHEGFPTVVGEAMACGTPVLATRVGGVPELVEEGTTGWLLEPFDDAMLVKKLTAILGSATLAAELRGAARTVAEERVSPTAVGLALKQCFDAAGERYGRRPQ